MDKLIIVLISVLIILVVVLIILVLKKQAVSTDTSKIEKTIKDEVGSSTSSFSKMNSDTRVSIKDDMNNVVKNMKEEIETLRTKVSESMKEGFKETGEVAKEFKEQMIRYDSTQKQVLELAKSLTDLEKILSNNKTAGNFGEFLLEQVLTAYYGSDRKLYQAQYVFYDDAGTKYTADAAIFMPSQIICIDSKFPVHFYKDYLDEKCIDKVATLSNLKKAIKTQIQETAKYIVPGITSDYSCMFVPSDSLLALIHNELHECIDVATANKVVFLSPSTLVPFISSLKVAKLDFERNEKAKELYEALKKLGVEFTRFSERYDAMSTKIQQLYKANEELSTTTEKLTKRFDNIQNMDFDNEE